MLGRAAEMASPAVAAPSTQLIGYLPLVLAIHVHVHSCVSGSTGQTRGPCRLHCHRRHGAGCCARDCEPVPVAGLVGVHCVGYTCTGESLCSLDPCGATRDTVEIASNLEDDRVECTSRCAMSKLEQHVCVRVCVRARSLMDLCVFWGLNECGRTAACDARRQRRHAAIWVRAFFLQASHPHITSSAQRRREIA